MQRKLSLPLLLAAVCNLQFAVCNLQSADWSHWRGPEQTGVYREKDLPEKWSPNPKAANNNLIWKVPVGGRTTPIVMNGRVYVIAPVGEGVETQERVVCLDDKN